MDNTPQAASRADACALGAAIVFPALLTWVYFVLLKDQPAAVQQAVYAAGKGIQFAFPLVWVLGVRRQRLRWPAAPWAGIIAAAVFGLAVAAVIVLFAPLAAQWKIADQKWLPAVYQRVGKFGVTGPAGYVAMGLFYAVIHSLLEESYWRWFVFGRLRPLLPLSLATVLASAAFAAHHAIIIGMYCGPGSPLTWLLTAAVAGGGAVWCQLYHRSGSLLGPWLSHALVDAAIFTALYLLVQRAAGW